MWGIQPWRLGKESQNPYTFPTWQGGSSFPGFIPPDYTVECVVDIKPGISDLLSGYQDDEFTCIWSGNHFIAQSHIYPGFTGKVSTLNHFTLEPV